MFAADWALVLKFFDTHTAGRHVEAFLVDISRLFVQANLAPCLVVQSRPAMSNLL